MTTLEAPSRLDRPSHETAPPRRVIRSLRYRQAGNEKRRRHAAAAIAAKMAEPAVTLPQRVESLSEFASVAFDPTTFPAGVVAYLRFLESATGETVYRLCRVLKVGRGLCTVQTFDDQRPRAYVPVGALRVPLAR